MLGLFGFRGDIWPQRLGGVRKHSEVSPRTFMHMKKKPDIFVLVALYVIGPIQNHPFTDANKCVAIITATHF